MLNEAEGLRTGVRARVASVFRAPSRWLDATDRRLERWGRQARERINESMAGYILFLVVAILWSTLSALIRFTSILVLLMFMIFVITLLIRQTGMMVN